MRPTAEMGKSSYYVLFLGALETAGLRGSEYVVPVLRTLELRERDHPPNKVTVQVNHKGLKIVQNAPSGDVAKHFIPHTAITCVHREDDLVAYIVFLHDTLNRCPIQVHAFRCDSPQTASVLYDQLRGYTEENQQKLTDLETQISYRVLPSSPRRRLPTPGSDGRSASSAGSSLERQDPSIADIYNDLTAELRKKLCTGTPILLPPKDYDTVHRKKGDLASATNRRCQNISVVGHHVTASSRGSSGFESDRAPSPDHLDTKFVDHQSTSGDDECIGVPQQAGSSGRTRRHLPIPRQRRLLSSDSSPEANQQPPQRSHSLPQPNEDEHIRPAPYASYGNDAPRRRRNAEERQRSPSLTDPRSSETPQHRFVDAKGKFLLLERETQEEYERRDKTTLNERIRPRQPVERPLSPAVSNLNYKWQMHGTVEMGHKEMSQHDYSATDDNKQAERLQRGEYSTDLRREPSYPMTQPHRSIASSDDLSGRQRRNPNLPYNGRDDQFRKLNSSPSRHNIDSHNYRAMSEDRLNHHRYGSPRREQSPERLNHHRYGSPRREQSPEAILSNDRCNSPSYNDPRGFHHKQFDQSSFEEGDLNIAGNIPRNHLGVNVVPFTDNNSIPLERYRSPSRVNSVSKQTTRQQRYPSKNSEEGDTENLEYRNPYSISVGRECHNYPPRGLHDSNEKKRMSMYQVGEDTRKKNLHDLANEFKSKSLQSHSHTEDKLDDSSDNYQELDIKERFPGLDRDSARIHQEAGANASPRYRHSYAEPFHHPQQPVPVHHEMLHRANSSLSSGRVGMAAVHNL